MVKNTPWAAIKRFCGSAISKHACPLCKIIRHRQPTDEAGAIKVLFRISPAATAALPPALCQCDISARKEERIYYLRNRHEWTLVAARFFVMHSESRDTHYALFPRRGAASACSFAIVSSRLLPLQRASERSTLCGRGRVCETWQRGDCENAAPLDSDSTIQPAAVPSSVGAHNFS
jgi:hypothetical protein